MSFILYLLQASFCLAVFYGFYVAALHKQTNFTWNRIYLLATLVLSMIIPLVKISLPEEQTLFILPAQNIFLPTISAAGETEQATKLDWKYLIIVSYLFVSAIFLSRILVEVYRILVIRSTGEIRTVNGTSCIYSDRVNMPFSFFKLLVLPSLPKYTDEELANIIRHETAHIRGGHSWDIMIMEIAGILLWFNPFMYFYKSRLREVHEFIADASVVRHTTWDAYASFLLHQKSYGIQLSVSNPLLQSQLEKRLIMLNKTTTSMISRIKYLGIIPIILGSLLLISFRGTSGLQSMAQGKETTMNLDTLPATVITALRSSDPDTQVNSDIKYTRSIPIFPGCEQELFKEQGECSMIKLIEFISKRLIYPEELKAQGIEGNVIIKFTIGADGWLKSYMIDKSLHPLADKAVLDVFRIMNNEAGKWIPSAENGIKKDTELWLPVKFSDEEQKEDPFTYVEEMPRFPGCEELPKDDRFKCCMEKMNHFLYSNISYPVEDRKKGNQGTVIAQFTIEKDGSVSDITIVRSVSPGLDAEAIRIVKAMNDMPEKWIPGYHNGQPVRVRFTLPFKFLLQSKKQK